ncbi:protein MIZU-KUSSEI 1-like [Cucurbita pepo subsp. pepo]|uniref:protein MIZU-KUSSEI 1-like n=1 Tax=Cucurbita pepo subsp. pepo TaxID=3664 RepID=UPI000C9D5A37|nr:protein MIZU-KUSSEI 1-like [Cucurbita pepo subsp. pepo]
MFLLSGFSCSTSINLETKNSMMRAPHSTDKGEETTFSLLYTHSLLVYLLPTNLLKNLPSLPLVSQLQPVMALESSSRRHFHWTRKVSNEDEDDSTFKSSESAPEEKEEENAKPISQDSQHQQQVGAQLSRRKLQQLAVSRFRSVLTALGRSRNQQLGLRSRVVGTLFGSRRGHVHFAFQRDPNSHPAFLIELATPISGLVKEMASGLVRIALECDKEKEENKKPGRRLLEEPIWRTFCNGKKCGFASRRECGPKEWKILKAVEPISMGAGVLPVNEGTEGGGGEGKEGSDGEIMYMRAKFERIVGSRDSEAFYMMNPDSNGAPELSVYLLRV